MAKDTFLAKNDQKWPFWSKFGQKLKILILAVESKKMGLKAQKIVFWPFWAPFPAKIGLFWPKIGQKSCYL